MENLVIRTENLKKSYKKGVYAVNGLNLEVKEKKITGFLGPNGAGKSTTIKMLLGLLEPTEGKIEIFGKEMKTDSPRIRKYIGFMPELPKFPKYLTGMELLEIYGEMAQMEKNDVKKQARELLEEVGLENSKDKKIGGYSKGMQQKLGIAVAFLGNPPLVIMDEPTEGLDPVGMIEVKKFIKQKSKNGTSIFLSSHLLKEVEEICDEVIVINKGKMVSSGSVEKVISEAYNKKIIEIEVDKIGNIQESLKKFPFVNGVKNEGNKLYVELNTDEDVRAVISKNIYENGSLIVGMRYISETLENAFIELLKNGGDKNG
ncbi:MAG: ABC transporter ATP-binding protein [Thermoplasmata archaeon]